MVNMKITIKLFGTLSQRFPDYRTDLVLVVELPEGSKVADLLIFLKLPESLESSVLMNGRFLTRETGLTDGSVLQIFQALYGG